MTYFLFAIFLKLDTNSTYSAYDIIENEIPCKLCKEIKNDMLMRNLRYEEISKYTNETLTKYSQSDRSIRGLVKILSKYWFEEMLNSSTEDSCSFVCDKSRSGLDRTRINEKMRHIKKVFHHRFSKTFKNRPQIVKADNNKPIALSKTHLGCDECVILVDLMLQLGPSYISYNMKNGLLYDACTSIELLNNHCSIFSHESNSRFIQYMAENLNPYEICVATNAC